MKRANLSFLGVAMSFMICACGSNTKDAQSANTTASDSLPAYDSDTSVNPVDTSGNSTTTFVLKAAAGGVMEVELGNMAVHNAANPRVKAFGAMMVKDHTQANNGLKAVADKENILVPSKLPDDVQKHIDEMKKLKGQDFDKHYIDMMNDDHKDDIDLFEKAEKNLPEGELKAFVSKTLPTLKMHLDSAKAIKKDMK